MAQTNDTTVAKVIMWGLIPLLTLVFTAGGGWWMLTSLDARLVKTEAAFAVHMSEHDRAGLVRRVDSLEEQVAEQDRRLYSIERNVIAICIATGAQCANNL